MWIISLVGALPWTRSSPILPLHTRHLSFCANSGRFSQMCMSLELDGYSGQFTMSLLDHGVGHSRLLKIGFQWILTSATFSWPFDSDASSYCLDTFNPLEGDQNLPYFPLYANNYTNIDISSVKPVRLNVNPASNSTVASATSSSTTSSSQSSTASPSSSSSESGSFYTAPLPSSLVLLLMVVAVSHL